MYESTHSSLYLAVETKCLEAKKELCVVVVVGVQQDVQSESVATSKPVAADSCVSAAASADKGFVV